MPIAVEVASHRLHPPSLFCGSLQFGVLFAKLHQICLPEWLYISVSFELGERVSRYLSGSPGNHGFAWGITSRGITSIRWRGVYQEPFAINQSHGAECIFAKKRHFV